MTRIKQQSKIILILFIVISVVTAFAVAGLESPEAAIQRKLDGSWNIEFENSFMDRDSIYEVTGVAVFFEKDNIIKLPDRGVYEAYVDQKVKGTWRVINTNPDSLLFDVPENTFHGKYAVRFFIDNNGGWVSASILKMELKNDSTVLTCVKTTVFFGKDLWDWENNGWRIWPE
jgi:hypothetical protein